MAGRDRAKAVDVSDELFDDGYYEELRDGLVDAFRICIEEYDSSENSYHFETGNREIMFTGRESRGDSPSGTFDAMCQVLACDLYYGDCLTKEQRALKKRIVDNAKAAEPKYREWFAQDLSALVHQLQSEVAEGFNNEGWENQLDRLFEEYGDSVKGFLEEYVGDVTLKILLAQK